MKNQNICFNLVYSSIITAFSLLAISIGMKNGLNHPVSVIQRSPFLLCNILEFPDRRCLVSQKSFQMTKLHRFIKLKIVYFYFKNRKKSMTSHIYNFGGSKVDSNE